MIHRALALLLVLFTPVLVRGQQMFGQQVGPYVRVYDRHLSYDPRDYPIDADLARDLTVSVVTFGPGDKPWEKFGHIAVEIDHPDWYVMYNWGTFDIDNTFMQKFAQGRLLYKISSQWGSNLSPPPTSEFYLRYPTYHDEDRIIHRQELNLSVDQRLALLQVLLRTDTDEHRFYLYDYFRDNCATRVRDAIDNVIGHRLRDANKGVVTGVSFRWHMERLLANTFWMYLPLQGVMGSPIDEPIDRWEEMYLPSKLHDRLSEINVVMEGREVPLVRQDLYFAGSRVPEATAPPNVVPQYLGVGMGIALLLALLGHLGRVHWVFRWGFVLASLPWLLFMFVGSAFLWFAWLCTNHVDCRYNQNVMHLSLLSIALLVLMPTAVSGLRHHLRTGKRGWLVYLASALVILHLMATLLVVLLAVLNVSPIAPLMIGLLAVVIGLFVVELMLPWMMLAVYPRVMAAKWIAFIIAGISLLGLVLKIIPGFHQDNAVIIALCLPPNLAIAYGLWRLSIEQRGRMALDGLTAPASNVAPLQSAAPSTVQAPSPVPV